MTARRYRAKDLKDLETFQDILATAGSYLPLNFMMKLFNRMKDNPEGFDHHWLRDAILVTRDMCDIHEVGEGEKALAYATTFLLESGRTYLGHPHDSSAAFAVVFLNEEADGFFDEDDIKMIQMCCKRVTYSALRPSVNTTALMISNEVRVMTDVLFPNPSKVVVEYVREHAVVTSDPVSPQEWCDALAEGFASLYGKKGSIWVTIPPAVLEAKPDSVANFQAIADNAMLIGTLVKDNYNRIFGKR